MIADAELLLLVARKLRCRRIQSGQGLEDTELARIKLAIDLGRRPATGFRAVVEEWPLERIVRELY